MRPRSCAGAGCAAALWLGWAAPSGAAAPTPILVPSPTTPLTAQPPVGIRTATLPQHIPRGRIDARTRVVSELDGRGAPIAVTAVQRLTIRGVGDYLFVIPAPLKDVLPGPGTQSKPGLRTGMVLWQGFSGGKRILSARLMLKPGRVAASLPIRVRLSRVGSGVTLELVNATTVRVSSLTGVAAPGEARRYLAALARFAAGGPSPWPYMSATDVRTLERTVAAPLRVTGALEFSTGRRVPLDLVLGPGRRRMRIATGATALPKLRLAVNLVPFKDERGSRPMFDDVMDSTLGVARARQYEMFVGSPDPSGSNHTTYVFRTAVARPTAIAPAPRRDSRFPSATLAIALGLGALVAACVVAWAHA